MKYKDTMEETRKPGIGIEKHLRFKRGICQIQLQYPPVIQLKTLQHPTLASVMYTEQQQSLLNYLAGQLITAAQSRMLRN